MTTFTPEQKLALIKHLASGKSATVVAAIMQAPESDIVEVARHHGYPDTDKLAWAADILEKNIEKDKDLEERPLAAGGVVQGPRTVVRGEAGPEAVVPLTKPDEIRILINTGKGHSSKRIQAQANRVLDAVDRLRVLLREDEEKNAEKRAAAAAKAAARAEVERLEAQLKAAKAKLKGQTSTPAAAADGPVPEGEHQCRKGCDQTFGTPQGRSLHERRAHAEAGAA